MQKSNKKVAIKRKFVRPGALRFAARNRTSISTGHFPFLVIAVLSLEKDEMY